MMSRPRWIMRDRLPWRLRYGIGRLRYKLRRTNCASWASVLASGAVDSISCVGGSGMRVLCATNVGSHAAKIYNSVFAMALKLRGAGSHLLLCDEVLPACEVARFVDFPDGEEFASYGPKPRLCLRCYHEAAQEYRPLPVPLHKFSQFIRPWEIRSAMSRVADLSMTDCFSFTSKGMLFGEQVRASVLRFFGKADLADENPAFVESVARRYLAGAIATATVAERLIEVIRPDCIVVHHGVYVPQGVMGMVARRRNIRLVVWAATYRYATVICSHNDTYHRTFLTEPVANWEHLQMMPAMDRELDEYLCARRGHREPWSWSAFQRRPGSEEHTEIMAQLGLDPTKPTFGLLTNVSWDAALYYQSVAFQDMFEWLYMTLDYFNAHPELQLIVRVHPHERKPWNREPSARKIAARYPKLPKNIRIVDAGDFSNTYSLMSLCRVVLIYGTKTGVELAPLGIPIVAASDAWVRNKGISYDPKSAEEYRALLGRLTQIPPLTSEQVARARRYAYHYFFRRTIPLSSLVEDDGLEVKLRVRRLSDLMPGADPGLDVVCNGILYGHEFICEAPIKNWAWGG